MSSNNPEPASIAGAKDKSVAEVAAVTLASIGSQVSITSDAAVELGRVVVKLADQRIRQRPWQAATAAACLGLMAGLLIRRR